MNDPDRKTSGWRNPRRQAFVATLLLCALLFSPGGGPALATPWRFDFPANFDKFVHALLFGFETFFLFRALRVGRGEALLRPLALALLAILALALLTELGQNLVPGRSAEWLDIAADLTGAGLMALLLAWNEWSKPRRTLAALEET